MVNPPKTYAELIAVLQATEGMGIVKRMKAVHGERYRDAFINGDWRGVSFKGQDMTGISLRGCNLLNTSWDKHSNIARCEFHGAVIGKGLMAAGGFAWAKFDDDQNVLIKKWRQPNYLPLEVQLDELEPNVSTAAYRAVDFSDLVRAAPDFATAVHWLDVMRDSGFSPRAGMVRLAVRKFSAGDDPDVLSRLIEPFLKAPDEDDAEIKSLLDTAIGRASSFDIANHWFSALAVIGVKPDLNSYNGLIYWADFHEGRRLQREYEKRGEPTDGRTYASLLRHSPDVKTSLALLDEMAGKVERELQHFRVALYWAHGRDGIKAVRARMAEDQVPPDALCFNRMLQHAGSWDYAKLLFAEFTALGLNCSWQIQADFLGNGRTPEEMIEGFRLIYDYNGKLNLMAAVKALCRVDPGGPNGPLTEIRDRLEGTHYWIVLKTMLEACAIPEGFELLDQISGTNAGSQNV